MENEWILISEYCNKSRVEPDFIFLLENEGLIVTEEHDNDKYIQISQLDDLELFSRLHYELSINVEGIDVIYNLLNKVRVMKQELNILRRQMDQHPFFSEDFFDDI